MYKKSFYCNGNHIAPKLLSNKEVNFCKCTLHKDKFDGEKYCNTCQTAITESKNGHKDFFCDGNHNGLKILLYNAEVDFCNAMKNKFNGKKYCMKCQIAMARGNRENGKVSSF